MIPLLPVGGARPWRRTARRRRRAPVPAVVAASVAVTVLTALAPEASVASDLPSPPASPTSPTSPSTSPTTPTSPSTSPPPSPSTSPSPSQPGGPGGGAVQVVVPKRTIAAPPGFRLTELGRQVDEIRFTTVAALHVPAAAEPGSVVLAATLQVDVPIRLAVSVRAWCEAEPATTVPKTAPDGTSARDVLVIGQNPLPGRSTDRVRSRTLAGRAVVDLPRDRPARCLLQVAPRTQTTAARSTMQLLAGRFTATPVPVVARTGQRPAVLVGTHVPKVRLIPIRNAPLPVRDVAAVGPVEAPGVVRAEGEVELTTCSAGYQLCPYGLVGTSVVDVGLVLTDVDTDGRACRSWAGPTRRVVITAALHHVKALVPAVTATTRCGQALGGALRIRHRSGNPVEVEPTLGVLGGAVSVQTHLWLVGTGGAVSG